VNECQCCVSFVLAQGSEVGELGTAYVEPTWVDAQLTTVTGAASATKATVRTTLGDFLQLLIRGTRWVTGCPECSYSHPSPSAHAAPALSPDTPAPSQLRAQPFDLCPAPSPLGVRRHTSSS